MTDFYALLNLQRKYFIDTSILRQKFYEVSRNYHPDHQINSEDKISDINLAYKSLSDPMLRLKHILELEGAVELLETPLSPEFLGEMMDLHENIESYRQHHNINKKEYITQKIDQFEISLQNEAQTSLLQYDSGVRNDQIKQSLARYYIHLRYLRRLKSALDGEVEL